MLYFLQWSMSHFGGGSRGAFLMVDHARRLPFCQLPRNRVEREGGGILSRVTIILPIFGDL